MRLHVPSLPWTETTAQYTTCAYTQKVVKFCQMMMSLGHEVVLYGGEGNEAPCTEHHVVVTTEERKRWFGDYDPIGVSVIPGITWDPKSRPWSTMNRRVAGLMDGCDEHDIICIISGWCQHQIAAAHPTLTVAEWGIGYKGVVPRERWGWCFESEAWRHHVYGRQQLDQGRWYDTVIPNSFDPADFELGTKPKPYLLFMGRMIRRKGMHVAAMIAERVGMDLIVAGPGGQQVGDKIVAGDLTFKGQYVGHADKDTRRILMRDAAVMFTPTLYLEPFGGVAVEAMFCGTPVVATPWGAFTETVKEGVSGAFFNTVPEGVAAVERALELDRVEVRRWANRYSIWNVRDEYDTWLRRLDGLWADGRSVGDWMGNGAAE